MIVSAGSSTEEMRNSKRYFREGFSGKYLALYMIMEKGIFVIIVNTPFSIITYRAKYFPENVFFQIPVTVPHFFC